MRCSLLVFTVSFLGTPALAQTPQTPWKGENLQFFPKDVSRPELV